MRARELMTASPTTIAATEPVWRAAVLMRDLDVGAIPVVATPGSRRVVGMLTDRDIVVRCSAEGHTPDCAVVDHMTPAPLESVREDDRDADVMERMAHARVRRLPVLDEDGLLTGIIAQADLTRHLGALVPERVEAVVERISRAPLVRA